MGKKSKNGQKIETIAVGGLPIELQPLEALLVGNPATPRSPGKKPSPLDTDDPTGGLMPIRSGPIDLAEHTSVSTRRTEIDTEGPLPLVSAQACLSGAVSEVERAIRAAEGSVVGRAGVEPVVTPGGRSLQRAKSGAKRHNRLCVEYVRDVYNLCIMGLSEGEIETFLGVSKGAVQEWCRIYPAFRRMYLQASKRLSMTVVNSLYKSATGFTVRVSRPVVSKDSVTTVIEEQYVPPNVNAQKYILNNREAKQWSERRTVEFGPSDSLAQKLADARKRVEGVEGPPVGE